MVAAGSDEGEQHAKQRGGRCSVSEAKVLAEMKSCAHFSHLFFEFLDAFGDIELLFDLVKAFGKWLGHGGGDEPYIELGSVCSPSC